MKIILAFFVFAVSLQTQAQSLISDSALEATLTQAGQYLTGMGKPKDEAKAITLYLQCAKAGSPKAMNALGIIYKEGTGVKADLKKATDWFTKAGELGYAKSWYNLGLIYKDAKTSAERDYTKAFTYFSKAELLNDEQSRYAKAYMLYKGFGCIQNYTLAAELFEDGAKQNRGNSMYFLGLCLRNGYGVPVDIEKAKYWLNKASAKGYYAAEQELATKDAENSNEKAKALAQQLKSSSDTKQIALNTYQKLEHSIPANAIEGIYKGYMIKYDWSGKYAINSSTITLDIKYVNGQLTGTWTEADSLVVPFQAILTPKSMIFKNTQYSRTDHYSLRDAVPYNFENAKLQWSRKDDYVYLSGNIQMFSPKRNEPEKPLFISLTRFATAQDNNALINLTNEDGSPLVLRNDLRAYPNPFNNSITVDFELTESCQVQMELLNMDGKVIYKNSAGKLENGNYTIQVKPQELTAGTYILILKYGNKTKSAKVVKL